MAVYTDQDLGNDPNNWDNSMDKAHADRKKMSEMSKGTAYTRKSLADMNPPEPSDRAKKIASDYSKKQNGEESSDGVTTLNKNQAYALKRPRRTSNKPVNSNKSSIPNESANPMVDFHEGMNESTSDTSKPTVPQPQQPQQQKPNPSSNPPKKVKDEYSGDTDYLAKSKANLNKNLRKLGDWFAKTDMNQDNFDD